MSLEVILVEVILIGGVIEQSDIPKPPSLFNLPSIDEPRRKIETT